MLSALFRSPSIMILVLAIVFTLIQRLLTVLSNPTVITHTAAALHEPICVVTIVPPGVSCDRIFALFLKASHPNRIKLNVLKFVRKDEVSPTPPESFRHSIRLKLSPASRLKDIAQSRIRTLRQMHMGERYLCLMSHDVDLNTGWDNTAIELLKQCHDLSKSAMLVVPPSPSSFDLRGTFMRPKSPDMKNLKLETIRYAAVCDSPCPSLFWTPNFSFSTADALAAFPHENAVNVDTEISGCAQHLWQHGYSFFTPPVPFVWNTNPTNPPKSNSSDVTIPVLLEGVGRSAEEYSTWLGVTSKGKPGRRTILGLTPRPSLFECEVKYGSREQVQEMLIKHRY